MDRIDQLLEKANEQFDRVIIERRGQKLTLWGSFPKKPGEGHGNKQRRIPLGIYANPEGVKVAITKAKSLESDLVMERFQWADWEGGAVSIGGKTAADWGREFGKVKAGTVQSASYHANYEEPLGSLPAKPLTEELLIAHVLGRNAPNTWKRKNDCMVFSQVAKLAGVATDFSAIRGKYKTKPVTADSVPSDEEIEAIWDSIRNPGWRWVYGMLATYGLRPHEVFRIVDTRKIASPTGKITIQAETKTGARDV